MTSNVGSWLFPPRAVSFSLTYSISFFCCLKISEKAQDHLVTAPGEASNARVQRLGRVSARNARQRDNASSIYAARF